MSYLLDTNVVSELQKPTANPHVRAWLASVSGAELYLSVLVIGEIRQGIERLRRRDPAQATVYETWLSTVLRDYGDRTIPIDADVAQEWSRLNARDPLPTVDGLMAATAKVLGWTLVTRDTTALARTGASILDPFEPA